MLWCSLWSSHSHGMLCNRRRMFHSRKSLSTRNTTNGAHSGQPGAQRERLRHRRTDPVEYAVERLDEVARSESEDQPEIVAVENEPEQVLEEPAAEAPTETTSRKYCCW